MTEKIITQKRLKELLSYSPQTGIFTWLISSARIKSEDISGCLSAGYTQIKVDGIAYYAHRLAFLYMTGKFPKDQTDHINHIRDDNRWENLRQANYDVNHKNKSLPSNNTSGHIGVHWDIERQKWMAYIKINQKFIHLGRYPSIADAIAARKAAEIKYGFHPNHGKVSC